MGSTTQEQQGGLAQEVEPENYGIEPESRGTEPENALENPRKSLEPGQMGGVLLPPLREPARGRGSCQPQDSTDTGYQPSHRLCPEFPSVS